jgi:hypothetical protein
MYEVKEKPKMSDAERDILIGKQADLVVAAKPGEKIKKVTEVAPTVEKVITMSFCLSEADSWKLKDLAAANKRTKNGEKSVTAIILKALRDTGVL